MISIPDGVKNVKWLDHRSIEYVTNLREIVLKMATILLMVGTAFEVVISAKLFRHQKMLGNFPATEEVVTNTIDLQSLYSQMERTFVLECLELEAVQIEGYHHS